MFLPVVTRRRFLRSAASVAAVGLGGCGAWRRGSTASTASDAGAWVNDVHSQINPTHVAGVEQPGDLAALARRVEQANRAGESLSLCGGRHAGGGQQFLSERVLLDLAKLDRVTGFDPVAGTVDIEAGARWPKVLAELRRVQHGDPVWSVHQKQGGADELSLGGAIASNVHGRCLASRPIVQDVLAMRVVLPDGKIVECSRRDEAELFGRVVGGYGLFGVVASVTLQLERRSKLVRRVRWIDVSDAVTVLEACRDAGAWHGDFQFSVDPAATDFCTGGLCSWYEPVANTTPIRSVQPEAEAEQTRQLLELVHQDKAKAMSIYRDALLAADGQAVDWSDDWQRGKYEHGYHKAIDKLRPDDGPASEILSELYVPREALAGYLTAAAGVLRETNAELIYGVVRLIERDDETVLAWATQSYACVIFNLHTSLRPHAIEKNAAVFRRLLDEAIARGGSYYLTYHRFARIEQTLACYPQLPSVLADKNRLDPRSTLSSDWHAYYRDRVHAVSHPGKRLSV